MRPTTRPTTRSGTRHIAAALAAFCSAALLLTGLASPSAAAATTALASPKTPEPTATLTGGQVTFTTLDEDKDADTEVWVGVGPTVLPYDISTGWQKYQHFDDNSVHGPYPLVPYKGPHPASSLAPGAVSLGINSLNGSYNDTWRFVYKIDLFFSDGGTYTVSNYADLSTGFGPYHPNQTDQFVVGPQAVVPDVVGRKSASAASAIKAVGLQVGTVGHQVDTTCNNIGTVMAQRPPAGTIRDVGTKVDYTVGDRPSTPCP